jgi:hypothetical protein
MSTICIINNKKVDVEFSDHDSYLEKSSSCQQNYRTPNNLTKGKSKLIII